MPSDAHDALTAAARAGYQRTFPNSGTWPAVLDAVLSARLETACPTCFGRGWIEAATPNEAPQWDEEYEDETPCPDCRALGTVPGPLALIAVLVERGVLIKAGQVWGSGEADVGRPVYSVVPTEQVKP